MLGDRCAATFGFGVRVGWHRGLTAGLESFFQPIRSAATGASWQPNVELLGTDGVLFLGGTSSYVDVYLPLGPWGPPGKLERFDAPVREIAPGPYAERGAEAPHHTAMVEGLTAVIEEGRAHRSSGVDGRWALKMIMGTSESHRGGGAQVTLPLANRDHPLDRWLREAGVPLPAKPDAPVKVLRAPGSAPLG